MKRFASILLVAGLLVGCKSGPTPPEEPAPMAHRQAPGADLPRPDPAVTESRREEKRERRAERRSERDGGGAGGDVTEGSRPSANAQASGEMNPATSGGTGGGSHRSHGRADVDDTPGHFDYYLLTLSWSPEFCATHPGKPECAAHPRFVLHGLWPENNDGSYPEDCSQAAGPANPGLYADLYPDQSLLAHEWQTHGTCSGLAPDAFFNTARKAYGGVRIPPELTKQNVEGQVSPGNIVGAFTQANPSLAAADLVVSCGNNRLTAVEVCLTKDLRPTACQGVRTCHANVVKITPP